MPQITAGFDFKSKRPLQDREYFDSVAEMKAFSENYINEGLMAVVNTGTSTDPVFKRYEWYSTNEEDETTGRWREFKATAEGGGTTCDCEAIPVSTVTNLLQ